MDGEHLSIKDTRKLLGVTTETLRKWANSGKIRFSQTPTDESCAVPIDMKEN